MTPPARVLILNDYAGHRGGAEIMALDLRRGLRSRGIEARLMTTRADPVPEGDDAPDATCFGTAGRARALAEAWNPLARLALRREVASFRPDLVHVMMFMTALSPAILAPLASVPVVHSLDLYRVVCPTGMRWLPGEGLCTQTVGRACRDKGCFTSVGLAPRLLQLAALERWRATIDRSIAPSRTMADILERHGWRVTDVVPHGVPRQPREVGMADAPTIAFSGRLTPEKGVGWLISAVAAAGSRLGRARVLIVGDGPERDALEALARREGIAAQVRFTGHLARDEAERVLQEAWVQVVPSLWPEPFGLVAAEALMRGTPVIASDAGAPGEMVREGWTGRVVATGDVVALAEALVAATRDRGAARLMGDRAAADARERFDQDRWLDACLAIYRELLALGPRASAAGRSRMESMEASP